MCVCVCVSDNTDVRCLRQCTSSESIHTTLPYCSPETAYCCLRDSLRYRLDLDSTDTVKWDSSATISRDLFGGRKCSWPPGDPHHQLRRSEVEIERCSIDEKLSVCSALRYLHTCNTSNKRKADSRR